jgi:hypothetical protein
MTTVPVQIVRFVDDYFPGIVECVLVDAAGTEHRIFEKGPVVSSENLLPTSAYPVAGSIACEVLEEWVDANGRAVARVTTDRPWTIGTTEGVSEFVLPSSMVRR